MTWAAPGVDSTHNAATGFNLRSSPSGASTWTTVSGVTSPYNLSGLAAGAAIDVQLQGSECHRHERMVGHQHPHHGHSRTKHAGRPVIGTRNR